MSALMKILLILIGTALILSGGIWGTLTLFGSVSVYGGAASRTTRGLPLIGLAGVVAGVAFILWAAS